MPTVKSIHLAPIKSLALLNVDRINVTTRGIEDDRRFMILDSAGRVITQRQLGIMTQVAAEYSADANVLRMSFPMASRSSEVRRLDEISRPSCGVAW